VVPGRDEKVAASAPLASGVQNCGLAVERGSDDRTNSSFGKLVRKIKVAQKRKIEWTSQIGILWSSPQKQNT
jgi:hypothetical protein